MRRKFAVLALVGACISMVFAQEDRAFKLYGFMDATFMKFWMPDNDLLNMEGFDTKGHVKLQNVNLYSSFKPNNKVSALIEVAYRNQPIKRDYGKVGVITRIDAVDQETMVAPGTSPESNYYRSSMISSTWGDINIERAHLGLKLNQYLNLSCGKFITPYGVWNVDHGSPVLLTIRQPNQVGMVEIFPKAQVGLVENGKVFLGDNDLDYTFYISEGRNERPIDKPKNLGVGGNASLTLPVSQGLTIGVSGFTGVQSIQTKAMVITMDKTTFNTIQQQSVNKYTGLYATAFAGEAMASGLTDPMAIQGYVMAKIADSVMNDLSTRQIPGWFQSAEAGNPDNHSYRENVSNKSREMDFGIDLRYKLKNFSLQGECNFQRLSNQLVEGNPTSNMLGWYVLGSYAIPISEDFIVTPYSMFENIKQEDSDKNPRFGYFSKDIPGFRVFLAGVNFRIYQNLLMKIEYTNVQAFAENAFEGHEDALGGNVISTQFSVGF